MTNPTTPEAQALEWLRHTVLRDLEEHCPSTAGLARTAIAAMEERDELRQHLARLNHVVTWGECDEKRALQLDLSYANHVADEALERVKVLERERDELRRLLDTADLTKDELERQRDDWRTLAEARQERVEELEDSLAEWVADFKSLQQSIRGTEDDKDKRIAELERRIAEWDDGHDWVEAADRIAELEAQVGRMRERADDALDYMGDGACPESAESEAMSALSEIAAGCPADEREGGEG